MRSVFLVMLIAAAAAGTAHAQVKKCVHPDGKVEYTEKPCGGGATVTAPKLTDNTTDGSQDRRFSYRQEQQYQQQASGGGGAQGSGGGNVNSHACQLAQREVSIAGGSTTSTPQQRQMAVEAAQQKANNACYGGTQAASIERARAGRPVTNNIIVQQPHAAPTIITHCVPGGCYTSTGQFIPGNVDAR